MSPHEAIQYLNSFINYEQDIKDMQKDSLYLERVFFFVGIIGSS